MSDAQEIKAGDIVALKSDEDFTMTVDGVLNQKSVRVAYIKDGTIHKKIIAKASLMNKSLKAV